MSEHIRIQERAGVRLRLGRVTDVRILLFAVARIYFKDSLSASSASLSGGKSSSTAFQMIEASTRW